MRTIPTVPNGLKDQKLIQFLVAVVRALRAAPDLQCYNRTAVWATPFVLSIPDGSGTPRPSPPTIVRLGRAVLSSEPETVVGWGASTLWTWQGNDTVKILDQSGLVEGVKYELTFEVIG